MTPEELDALERAFALDEAEDLITSHAEALLAMARRTEAAEAYATLTREACWVWLDTRTEERDQFQAALTDCREERDVARGELEATARQLMYAREQNQTNFKALTASRAEVERLRAALRPLAQIADRFDDSNLDEHRHEWGAKDPKSVELLTGRGGGLLLSLDDALTARAVLAAEVKS